MKRQLIAATAFAALLAGTSLVSAQRAQEGGSSAPSAAPSAAQPSPGAQPSDRNAAPPSGRAADDKAAPKAAQSAPAERSGAQPSGRMNSATDDKAAPRQPGTQAQQNREPAPANRANQAQSPSSNGTQAQSPAPQTGDRASSQTNVNVNLSTDQRTRIRQTVLRESGAPRIARNEVNFNIAVGTVVPRTVHVATLPAAVIEIHPAWRGYSYLLVGDEILVLEPGSLRIVAIIPA